MQFPPGQELIGVQLCHWMYSPGRKVSNYYFNFIIERVSNCKVVIACVRNTT